METLMRKELLEELFNLDPTFDWESTTFASIGDELIKEGYEIDIFKETQDQQILFGEMLIAIDDS